MPRTRRRHHSRSRTRSRSHSYDRDRDPKRRKLESYESPQHKSSLSQEETEPTEPTPIQNLEQNSASAKSKTSSSDEANVIHDVEQEQNSKTDDESNTSTDPPNTSQEHPDASAEDCVIVVDEQPQSSKKSIISKLSQLTPTKPLSPKQLQKKLESRKRLEEKLKEREKRKQQLLDEKLKVKHEKQKMREEKEQQRQKDKLEKQEQKQKEIDEKQKEKDLKDERKKKEREEKEQKRKEREEQKKKELEEKSKIEEKKQKAAAVFANFFTKKVEGSPEEKRIEDVVSYSAFMPFQVKSDMALAPVMRHKLSTEQKAGLIEALLSQESKMYLEELKMGKVIGRSGKTWPVDHDDVIILEVNPGESIEEQFKTNSRMRAKYLKFADNRRPAYFGTWRKKSKLVTPRKPLALDTDNFDYEVDSDEDWEEGEDKGESLHGSDDDDKENESENEYEVDNEFFVPHGHLSDDEVNDEEDGIESPEAHKAKLKLLKKEFEEEMQGQTHKIKPRVIGCIWYKKDESNVDPAINAFLKPLSIISNGPIVIKKRSAFVTNTPSRKSWLIGKPLGVSLVPDFLKLIHGNVNNQRLIIKEFINYLDNKNMNVEVTKSSLGRQLKQFAHWTRCTEDGPLNNKFCWRVHDGIKQEYNVDLSFTTK